MATLAPAGDRHPTRMTPEAGDQADPIPLTFRQLRALGSATTRELLWGLRRVAVQHRRWRSQAAAIPDLRLRQAALGALRTKRGHVDGAALFTTLPRRRQEGLLQLLVAYQVMLDYLDSAHEQVPDGQNGRQLHLALVDALDPERPLSDWYRHHASDQDGGYLRDLVLACRAGCRALPSYTTVRSSLLREAWQGQVLALNHITDPERRDQELRRWADTAVPTDAALAWYELCSAASSTLVTHVLLALAAETGLTHADVAATEAVYWPWVALTANMLDSYVDQADDRANGDHVYVAHYPTHAVAVRQIAASIDQACRGVRGLRHGQRHAVIVASMIALYLSKHGPDARSMAGSTRTLAGAGGSLTRLLVPVLRVWRTLYRQRST